MSLAPLMGVPGKLKTLLDRIGSSTPTQLARLDTTISSRAPSSTALSNATWTNARAAAIDTINTNAARLTATRAGYLDRIDDIESDTSTILARVPGVLPTAIGTVESTTGTYPGTDGASTNFAVSVASPSKAYVVAIHPTAAGSIPAMHETQWTFTSATNLQITRRAASGGNQAVRIYYVELG